MLTYPIGKYVVIRSYAAGVHYGILDAYDPATRHASLKETRRLWYWNGAFSLSAVANSGVKKGSKISETLEQNMIAQVEEIIPTTADAEKILREFAVHTP